MNMSDEKFSREIIIYESDNEKRIKIRTTITSDKEPRRIVVERLKVDKVETEKHGNSWIVRVYIGDRSYEFTANDVTVYKLLEGKP